MEERAAKMVREMSRLEMTLTQYDMEITSIISRILVKQRANHGTVQRREEELNRMSLIELKIILLKILETWQKAYEQSRTTI